MKGSQRRFIILTVTLSVSSLISLRGAITTHKMAPFSVEVETGGERDPATDGMLTQGPGTW